MLHMTANQRWACLFIVIVSVHYVDTFFIIPPIISTIPTVWTILQMLAVKFLILVAIGATIAVIIIVAEKILDAIHDKKNAELVEGLFPVKVVAENQELLCKLPRPIHKP
jgi:hypothetical protein